MKESHVERSKRRLQEARDALSSGAEPRPAAGRSFEEDRCADCFEALPPTRRALFCSDECKERAKLIRYWRAVTRDGRIRDEEVRYAIRVRIAFMLSGGYPSAERALSAETRASVIRRDGGRCVMCGAPGEEIDHIHGNSSAMENLQLLCKACHRSKTEKNLVPADPEVVDYLRELERDRVVPATPLLLCDDSDNWGVIESRLRSERTQRLKGNNPGVVYGETALDLLPHLVAACPDEESPENAASTRERLKAERAALAKLEDQLYGAKSNMKAAEYALTLTSLKVDAERLLAERKVRLESVQAIVKAQRAAVSRLEEELKRETNAARAARRRAAKAVAAD